MKRQIIAQLTEWKNKNQRKPLLLKGARQIGKTYSLLEFAKDEFCNYHYLNFEENPKLKDIFVDDLDPKKILQKISFEIGHKIDSATDLLILDEIQECPRALTSLKYFCEDLPEQAICAAGSLLGVRLNDVSFPVGKVDHLEMYPLNFFEFVDALNKPLLSEALRSDIETISFAHEQLWNLLKIYFITGGLPEVVQIFVNHQENHFEALNLVRTRQKEIINDYIGDMAKHSGKENAMHLQRLWANIAQQLSQTQDGSTARFKFKGAIPEKNRYSRLISTIDWLEAAGLIIKVPIITQAISPLKAYSKENIFKLFIFDVGILGALIDLEPKTILNYDYGTYKGFFAENFVAQDFLTKFTSYKQYYAWQQNRLDIEFIIDIDGEIYPIEVKSGTVTKSQSLYIFAKKYQHKYLALMSAQKPNLKAGQELQKYPLYLASRFPWEF